MKKQIGSKTIKYKQRNKNNDKNKIEKRIKNRIIKRIKQKCIKSKMKNKRSK